MTTKPTIHIGSCTSAGRKPQNEDALNCIIPDETLLQNKGVVGVIADGVSSSSAAREASQACVQGFISDYYSTPDSWTVKTSGRRVLGAINRWLYGQSIRNHGLQSSMLTTFSGCVIKSTTAHIFHIGDSRIYLYRDGDLECLTRDHTMWMTEQRAFLSRAMGADHHVEIDYRSYPLEANDILLFTTDGIHDYLSNKQLSEQISTAQSSLQNCANKLVEKALEAGSNDNVSCLLMHIEQLPEPDEDEFYRKLIELPFPPPLDAGMKIDNYEILREIHASKRTQVYLARDMMDGQKVVIKTPSVNYADDAEYIDHFMHEEWVGKRLSSDHTLKIVSSERPRHFLYYVTEYLQGQTLREWMHDHPVASIKEVRDIIKQIASGLRAMHRLEMIHQDLKPENIFIDQHGTVKIIDFGSTRIPGFEELSSPFNNEQGFLGTLHYAAPECLKGEKATNRSDIFSLSVITYEMLTGKLPYGDKDTVRATLKHPYMPARQINKLIPDWLEASLIKGLKKDPQRRYQLLSEFVHDITYPNPQLLVQPTAPLLERNPLGFWRGLSMILLAAIILLLIYR